MTQISIPALAPLLAGARATAILILLLIAGCATGSAPVSVLSENQSSRVNIVVIHFTTADFDESLTILTKPSSYPVSAHYLIPEPGDSSYDRRNLRLYQLVPETRRAWHAGRSYWGGKIALNDQSIGIELVNRAFCHARDENPAVATAADGRSRPDDPARMCFFPDFAAPQIDLLVDLLEDILARNPGIAPTSIVGHADIAPGRKEDPGPRFPWQRLYRLGYGAWYDDDVVIRYWERFLDNPLPLGNIQQALNVYGYGIDPTGCPDQQTYDVLQAFQMHFRPSEVSGAATPETVATLFALIEKYFPDKLEDLLSVADTPGAMPGPGLNAAGTTLLVCPGGES